MKNNGTLKLLKDWNYNDNWTITGYNSYYQTVLGTIINNVVKTKNIYESEDLNDEWRFAPILLVISGIIDDVSNHFRQSDIGNFKIVSSEYFINTYLEIIKQDDKKNYNNDLLIEIKDYNSWLKKSNFDTAYISISDNLLTFYIQTAREQTLILNYCKLLLRTLLTPNLPKFDSLCEEYGNKLSHSQNKIKSIYRIKKREDEGVEEVRINSLDIDENAENEENKE